LGLYFSEAAPRSSKLSGARAEEQTLAFLMKELNRRGVAALAAAIGAGVLVRKNGLVVPVAQAEESKVEGEDKDAEEVSATEDMMREHGVLRRTLIVYSELATRLRTQSGTIDPLALADAAKLFREFGEDYHERMLEEQYVFPEVRKAGGPNEKLVEILLNQHQRGRDITDYLYRVGSRGRIGSDSEVLATVLASMVRMYEPHAAWEDTVIFPAWKKTQSKSRLAELADKFEEIEHGRFGKDGFDEALERIERVERALNLGELGAYTAPADTSGTLGLHLSRPRPAIAPNRNRFPRRLMIRYRYRGAQLLYNPHQGSYDRGVPFSNNKMFWYLLAPRAYSMRIGRSLRTTPICARCIENGSTLPGV
jgi:hemerythrin-like domain-containing protein